MNDNQVSAGVALLIAVLVIMLGLAVHIFEDASGHVTQVDGLPSALYSLFNR